ncbi:unnamed protein product [Thelazia callipaeda]|uniref:Ig-like domain-containing protein n=1 Tax=Thelazia callipaeda TaxID=103827 RepID=A0A0N5CZM5_THECL|nr:unnamed protein product [Thelazia callipaeda]
MIKRDFACGPVIAAPLEEIHKIREGDTVSFVCIVWGDPQPLVEWHKSNYSTQIYSDNDRILIETSLANNRTYHLMHIREITPQDESIYWCKASTGFFSTSKYFNLQVMEANTPNTVDNNPLSFLTNNKDYSLKSRDKFQKLLQSVQQQQQQQVKPIWQLMLLCLLSFAVVLFFVVCTICLVYWRQTQNNIINLVNNNELEKVIQPSTLMNEKVIESISNFEQLNSETSHSVSDQTPSVNVSYRSGQELARKAPLAQYDCDTCKLPLVQTSL